MYRRFDEKDIDRESPFKFLIILFQQSEKQTYQ